ncbi:MAG: AIR synthase-related protein, partial [Acidimicrobiia bacterium]
PVEVRGLAHITSGGFGNLLRLETEVGFEIDDPLPAPPIFELIRRSGDISRAEMDRTFNNGLGMILVIEKKDVDRVERSLKKMREKYSMIGEIKKGERGVEFIS